MVIIISGVFVYLYLFNIYEVEISVIPKELFADNQSSITIQVFPLNSFGKRIPFRYVSAKFRINEGKELVAVKKLDESHGLMILRAMNKTGTVVVFVDPEKSLLPSLITIQISPNYATSKY